MGKAISLRLVVGLIALLLARAAWASCANTITIADANSAQHTFCRGTDGGSNFESQVQLIDGTGTPQGTAGNPINAAITSGSVSITGAAAVTQSGTWTVQPGNTANTTPWLVTGAGGAFPATQNGTWSVRLQDGLGNNIVSVGNDLSVNLAAANATVTVTGTGTFQTSDAHFPATQPLTDSLSNPTVTGIGAYTLLWDATNSVYRRAQAQAGTGAMQVDVVAGVAGGTSSNYGAVFPSQGTAIGFRNNSGNMDYALVDANHDVNISCGGVPCNATDNTAFTLGTSGYSNIGCVYQSTPTNNPINPTGNAGAAQCTTYRAIMFNPRDSAGSELADTTNHALLAEAFTTNNTATKPVVCGSFAKAHITTATDTQLVPASGSTNIRICDFEASAAGAVNWYFEKSSTGTCGSPTQIGILWTWVGNQGHGSSKSIYNGFNTGASQQLCVNTSSNGGLDIGVYYDQF